MWIKRYDSDQFAGTRNFAIDFDKGMNVVLGDNETGKSTMIAALFYLLTLPFDTNLNKRPGIYVRERYFPANGEGNIQAKAQFMVENIDYELEKVWARANRDRSTKLTRSNGGMLRGNEAETLLQKLLHYSPGIYDNLVFGRQNNQEQVLEWCYTFFNQRDDNDVNAARQKIASALSAAGGISEDKFLSLLNTNLEELKGRWDFQRDAPENGRGIDNPWKMGAGKIVKAYYACEEAKKKYNDAVQAEKESARLANELQAQQAKKEELKHKEQQLLEQKSDVDDLAKTEKLLKKANEDFNKASFARESWSELAERIASGQQLLKFRLESENRRKKDELLNKLKAINTLETGISDLEAKIKQSADLPADYTKAKKLFSESEKSRLQLGAAKLHASIQLETGYTAELSQAKGETQQITASSDLDVDGFINLSIPGVANIRVTPRNLDVDALQKSIAEAEKQLGDILVKYDVDDLNKLESLLEVRKNAENDLKLKKQELKLQLGGAEKTKIIADSDAIAIDPALSIPEDLDALIKKYLGRDRSLEAAIAAAETKVNGYIGDYGNQEKLAERIKLLMKEVGDCTTQLGELNSRVNITAAEYEKELANCKTNIAATEAAIANLYQSLGALSVAEPADLTDLAAEVERLENELQIKKEEYKNYETIKKDFEELKSRTDDKFAIFNEKFNGYLAMIAGPRLSLRDDQTLTLKSGDNEFASSNLLSEGTKRTVLLAFRLAVLEYLFPDGGGLIALDDDLLDMDPYRRAKSIELLQEFAKNNQVIFATCDPGIADALGGNLIRLNQPGL